MTQRFDVRKFVDDLGGVTVVARWLSVPRTTPYRWFRQGHITTSVLAKLKQLKPKLNINRYFMEE